MMTIITHPIYQNYPEQPYISPERDLKLWETNPELFHYGIVSKIQMQRLPEGVLPGDIVMLWRIHFNTFTTESIIPQYFEYRYGVDAHASITTLIKLGFAERCNATETLPLLNVTLIRSMLKAHKLSLNGKKAELLQRVIDNIPEQQLATLFSVRKYKITALGSKLLAKYDAIIQKHGPKM